MSELLLGGFLTVLAGLLIAATFVTYWPDRAIAIGEWILRRLMRTHRPKPTDQPRPRR